MTEHAPTVGANCGVRLCRVPGMHVHKPPKHYAFRVKCHSGLGSRTNMQSATPAPDASCTPLEGNKCHCLAHGLGTGGSEPKTYRNRF